MSCSSRWPTVYDFEQLQNQISQIVKDNYSHGFYETTPVKDELYQGDVVKLDNKFVFVNYLGEFEAQKYSQYWIILGNSCDFARTTDDLPFTNLVPLQQIDTTIPRNILDGLKKFQNYKHMYIPNFLEDGSEYFIDFTKILTVSKEYLNKEIEAIKIKELSYASWVLFHSCIIRYFARDDGRDD